MEKDKEQIDSCPVQHYDRREFINLAWWGTAGLLALTGISATVASLWPRPKAGPFGRKMTAGKLEDFLPASVTYFPEYRFYLVRLPMKGGGTGLLALYRRCTHLGCVVPWLPEEPSEDALAPTGRFHCPCHGSIYNRYGEVVSGPAPRPLDIFPITIAGNEVEVNTAKAIRRQKFDESQVTQV